MSRLNIYLPKQPQCQEVWQLGPKCRFPCSSQCDLLAVVRSIPDLMLVLFKLSLARGPYCVILGNMNLSVSIQSLVQNEYSTSVSSGDCCDYLDKKMGR